MINKIKEKNFLLNDAYVCNSKDSKPIVGFGNGDLCIETDTGNRYLFDAETGEWVPFVPIPHSNKMSGSLLSFVGNGTPLKSLIADIKAKQDLNGYSSPWISNVERTPYLSRIANNGGDTGNKENDVVVGGTIAWNQLANPQNTVASQVTATVTDGHVVVSGTSDGSGWFTAYVEPNAIANHVYLAMATDYDEHGDERVLCLLGDFAQIWNFSSQGSATIINNTNGYSKLRIGFNRVVDLTYAKEYTPQIFDLTQMFGATIADYIFGLEQANKGAGVAYFRNLFPNDYYAYDSGSLQSVNTSEHIVTGKNLVGLNVSPNKAIYYSNVTVGEHTNNKVVLTSASNTYAQMRLFYRLLRGTYTVSFNGTATDSFTPTVTIYKDVTNTILANSVTPSTPKTFTITEDTDVYIAFFATTNTATVRTVTFYDFQLEYGSATAYEQYSVNTYALDNSLTLRGLPKLDANNGLYYDGDEYTPDGTVKRKYFERVFDGTESWTVYSGVAGMYFFDLPSNESQVTRDAMIGNYITVTTKTISQLSLWEAAIQGTEGNYYRLAVQTGFATKAEWETYLSTHNLQIVAPLATETTETADSYTALQEVTKGAMEIYTDYGVDQSTRDVAIPVGHKTNYINYCPISGFDGANITAAGKNLIDDSKYYRTNAQVKVFGQTDNTTYQTYLKAGTYIASIPNYSSNTSIWYQSATVPATSGGRIDLGDSVNIPEDGYYRIWVYSPGSDVDNITKLQLELGSTATAYEPYEGKVYVESWGKNLIAAKYPGRTNNGITYTVNADGTITAKGLATDASYCAQNYGSDRTYAIPIPPGTYTLSPKTDGITGAGVYLAGKYADDSALPSPTTSGDSLVYVFTQTAWVYPQIAIANGTDLSSGHTFNIQLESGSTATAFEPYMAGIVCGGFIDIVTGVLIVTHIEVSLDGTEGWTLGGTQGGANQRFNILLDDAGLPAGSGVNNTYISSYFKPAGLGNNSRPWGEFYISGTWFVILDGNDGDGCQFADASEFTTWLADMSAGGNPVKVVYKLATPQAYQLSPEHILTLVQNNIWSDIGDVTAEMYVG